MDWKRNLLLSLACLTAIPAAVQAQTPATFGTIVVFRDDADFSRYRRSYVADERTAANPPAWGYLDKSVAGAVQDLERSQGFLSEHVYSATVRGFSAHLTAQQIAALESDPRVARVEEDGEAHTSAQTLSFL